MITSKRFLGACAALALSGLFAPAVHAGVSNTTAATGSAGSVPGLPDPIFGFSFPIIDFAFDAQPSSSQVPPPPTDAIPPPLFTVTNDGAETAEGAAKSVVDLDDLGDSSVHALSRVATAPAGTPSSTDFFMSDASSAAYTATVIPTGVGPGSFSVDLVVEASGSLLFVDPSATASTSVFVDPFDPTNVDIVSDMTTSVSLLVAAGDVVDVVSPLGIPLDALPFSPLFSGSAAIESTTGTGTPPALVRGGDWADPARDGDFTSLVCAAATACAIGVNVSLLLEDIGEFSLGEPFDVGLALLTGAEALSDPGRLAESSFFGGAAIGLLAPDAPGVRFTVVPEGVELPGSPAVPEPATIALLIAGLLLLAARRGRASLA